MLSLIFLSNTSRTIFFTYMCWDATDYKCVPGRRQNYLLIIRAVMLARFYSVTHGKKIRSRPGTTYFTRMFATFSHAICPTAPFSVSIGPNLIFKIVKKLGVLYDWLSKIRSSPWPFWPVGNTRCIVFRRFGGFGMLSKRRSNNTNNICYLCSSVWAALDYLLLCCSSWGSGP